MKIRHIFFIILLSLVVPNSSFSKDDRYVYSQASAISFFKYPDDSFMAFRSNTPHYWSFVRQLKNDSQFSELFYINGIGIGDFHMLNIGDVELANGVRRIGLVDIDDAGTRVPLLLDLARQLVASQLAPVKSDLGKLVDAFIFGIQETSVNSTYVESIINFPHELFKTNYSKMIEKMTKNNRFSKDADINPLKKAPIEIQALYKKMRPTFKSVLSVYDKHYQLLDHGFKIKTSGGSKGILRFVYLIENSNKQKEIIEFKQFIRSSVDSFDKQGTNRERFDAAKKEYRPNYPVVGLFELAEQDNYSFISRSILPSFIDFSIGPKMKELDKVNLQDFIQFTVNQYGLTVRNQLTAEQIQWLINRKGLLKSQLIKFVKLYQSELYLRNGSVKL